MFTQKTKNAIRIVFLLSKNEEGSKMSALDISNELTLNTPFISKILQDLSRKKIISSAKGRGGGFFLSKENKEKRIIDIIEVFEDPMKIQGCILGLLECTDQNPCILHHIYKDFKISIGAFLEKNINGIIIKD